MTLRELLREGDLRLASEAELEADFPLFEVGALPPLGPLLPAPEVVDVRLVYRDRIVSPGGNHQHSLALDPRELIRLTEPLVADICAHEPPLHDEGFYELPRILRTAPPAVVGCGALRRRSASRSVERRAAGRPSRPSSARWRLT